MTDAFPAPLRPAVSKPAVALLILAVALLQLGTLNIHSLWNDEFITLRTINMDYRGMIADRLNASHVPGYFIALKAWTSIFGESQTALRFLSAISSLIGILLVWRIGAGLFGERMAVFVLLLAGLNQMHLEQGASARMYATLFMASALSLWGLIRYLDTGRLSYLFALFFAGLLGISIHLLYVFAPIAAAIYLFLCPRINTTQWRRALLAVWLPVLMMLPLVAFWTSHQKKISPSSSSDHFAITDALRQTFIEFTGDYHAHNIKAVQLAAFLLAGMTIIFGLIALRRESTRPAVVNPIRHLGLLLLWIFTPMLLIAASELFSSDSVAGNTRYYAMQAAAAPLLVVAVFSYGLSHGSPRLARAFLAACIAVVAFNTAAFLVSPGPGLRETVQFMRDRHAPGDAIVVSRDRNRKLMFDYYGMGDAAPMAVPESIDKADDVAQWVTSQTGKGDRFWAVFYDDLRRDKLLKALEKRTDLFEPAGELFVHGETATRLHRVK